MTGPLSALAPAKVNLYLHVGPLDATAYHPVASLAAFADVGDQVTIAAAGRPSLEITGPFAAALAGASNLISRALQALADQGLAVPDLAIGLDKQLPVASGLGGGSSDAGAVLRLVAQMMPTPPTEAQLEAAARAVGSDGPLCLWARPAVAEGRGERLSPAPPLPSLPAVLVNPGVACPTGRVYAAFDQGVRGTTAEPVWPRRPLDSPLAVTDWLRAETRNDLQAPAIAVCPVIETVLTRLSERPQTRLARVSGSGATVFALCADEGEAKGLADSLSAAHPDWWVRQARLG